MAGTRHVGSFSGTLDVPFLQAHITLGGLDPEHVEAVCFALGSLSVTLSDAGDSPILEPLPGATPLWPTTALTALWHEQTDTDALAAALRHVLGRAQLAIDFEHVADRAWEREWLKDFKPMRFGRRLWVCPGGQPPPDGTPADAVIVWLDPGLAFGTGTHATTALCLDWLDGLDVAGRRVLDVGCGSGILAVAALRLGAMHAIGIDIDPQALIASRDNATRNEVADRLALADADPPWDGDYDVVLANILAEPLIALAPRIAAATRAGGHLVLAGLLDAQADDVAQAYRPYFTLDPAISRDGWTRLSGRREG